MTHALETVTDNDRVILHNVIVAINQAQGNMPSASHLQNLMFFLEIEYFSKTHLRKLDGVFRMGVLGAFQSGVHRYIRTALVNKFCNLQTITLIDAEFDAFFQDFIKEYKSVSEYDLMCYFFDLMPLGIYSTGDFLYVNVVSDLLTKQKKQNEQREKIKRIAIPF